MSIRDVQNDLWQCIADKSTVILNVCLVNMAMATTIATQTVIKSKPHFVQNIKQAHKKK